MSKLTDSLLSGSSGRVGRLVVANVSGVEILKHRPKKRTKPPTPKQALIQNRMKMCGEFIESYKSFAKLYYGQRFGLRSAYNQAMTNLINSHQLDFNTLEITPQYPEIEFSKGMLLGAVPAGISSPEPLTLQINWADNSGGNPDRETDSVQILYVEENARKSYFAQNAATRADGTLDLPVSMHLAGKQVHAWMAFLSADEVEVSNSVYLGSITIS
ncbi:MAG: hypothetical protein ABS44_02875 [Chryseobacterium sp. SCN 40-13]|nr:MAG: hypothetical protein ABS44_02875 [Chryseobacterium sp. SCN 40-13]